MKPRRVLMTADAMGGVFTYALELASGLANRQVDTTIATMGDAPAASQRRELATVRRLDHVHGSFRLEWMDDPWGDVDCAGEWLLDLERRLRPDIVHLNGYSLAAFPFRAPTIVV